LVREEAPQPAAHQGMVVDDGNFDVGPDAVDG
jgi:hypothetical protein